MAESWNTASCSSNQRKKTLSTQDVIDVIFEGSSSSDEGKSFCNSSIDEISMEMEKRFPELLFQIVKGASRRVTCTETWNYSQIINETLMIVMMLVIMITHLTILTPSLCRQSTATKRGVHCSAMKQRVLEIFGF